MSTGQPIVNFNTYIHKVLRQVHPDTRISEDSSSQLCSFLCNIGTKLSEKASFLVNTNFSKKNKQDGKPHTLSARDIQSAVRLILPGELAKHAVSEGTKAASKFTFNKGMKGDKATRAGLIFSPSRAEKLIRRNHCGRVGEKASVYLASVLEYLCAEIIELSGNITREHDKKTIKPRHIFLAISNDEELTKLVKTMHWEIVGGGTVPLIHPKLIPKKK